LIINLGGLNWFRAGRKKRDAWRESHQSAAVLSTMACLAAWCRRCSFLCFHCYGNVAIRGEPDLVTLDLGDESAVYKMLMVHVRSFPAVLFSELYSIVFKAVDRRPRQ
jgi:hypothetical protein